MDLLHSAIDTHVHRFPDVVTRSGNFSAAFVLAGLMPPIALAGLWFATWPEPAPNQRSAA